MAPLHRSSSPAGSRGLEVLEAVELRWRSALSHLEEENVAAASADLDVAGELLQELPPAPLADLPELATRVLALQRLHAELLDRSRAGLLRVGARLQQSRLGARTLKAYSSGQHPGSVDHLG